MTALLTWAPEDGILGTVAPLALAAVRGTALVVDLDPDGPRYPGELTLARLVGDGPRRIDLEPQRRGVAVLPNGGIAAADAADVLAALVAGWPVVVGRLPPARPPQRPLDLLPVATFRPLLAGALIGDRGAAAVWQAAGWKVTPPGPGPVLPRARAATVAALVRGVRPRPDRWLFAMRRVWEWPWR